MGAMASDRDLSGGSSLAATPDLFEEWSNRGTAVFDNVMEASEVPNEKRAMRTFRRSEVLSILGEEYVYSLRRWSIEHATARSAPRRSDGQIRLTIGDIHGFMDAMGILPSRPAGSKPARVMVGAYKGGSGKSTLTLHLAHYLGLRMWKVLVIDTDPQASLTKMFGVTPETCPDEATIKPVFEALSDGAPFPPLPFQPTHFPTVSITPASMALMHIDVSLALAFSQQRGSSFYEALDASIKQVEDQFDVILIDTPPAFSLSSVATLYASNALILPVPAATPDLAAAFDFTTAVADMFSQINEWVGHKKVWDPVVVVHTKVDANQNSDIVRQLAGTVYQGHRLEEHIPATTAFNNAYASLRSVYEVTSTSVNSKSLAAARHAYDALCGRILRCLQTTWNSQEEATNGKA